MLQKNQVWIIYSKKAVDMQLNVREDLKDEIMSMRIAVIQEKDLNCIRRSLGIRIVHVVKEIIDWMFFKSKG